MRTSIKAIGLSQWAVAEALAANGHGEPKHLYRSLRRWLAYEPRPGAFDVPPDWLVDAIKKLTTL